MSKEYTRQITALGITPNHGPILYQDDFEHTLNWVKSGGVGDAFLELDPSLAFSGNQSLHLKTRTTDPAENDNIAADLLTYISPSKKLSHAFFFRSPSFDAIKQILFSAGYYDGTDIHDYSIQFNPPTPIWQYRDSGGILQDIPSSALIPRISAWHRFLLNINLNTEKYISFSFDNHFFDLSDLSYHVDTSVTLTHHKTQIKIWAEGAAPADLSVDDFITHEL